MKTKNSVLFALLLTFLFPTLGQAQQETFDDYDSIVDQLSTPSTRTSYSLDPFANIKLHAGVSLAMSMASIEQNRKSYTGFLQGVELNFGIDLFSRYWMAEWSYRNLGQAEIKKRESGDLISFNEFDMKVVHRSPLGRLVDLRSGFGLAARYATHYDSKTKRSYDYTTPSSLLLIGLDARISSGLSFGAELSYRNAMIDETIDKSSMAAGLRVDTHF